MGRDIPVHRVSDCRRATALDAAGQSTAEVSLAMDVAVLAMSLFWLVSPETTKLPLAKVLFLTPSYLI